MKNDMKMEMYVRMTVIPPDDSGLGQHPWQRTYTEDGPINTENLRQGVPDEIMDRLGSNRDIIRISFEPDNIMVEVAPEQTAPVYLGDERLNGIKRPLLAGKNVLKVGNDPGLELALIGCCNI